MNRYAPPRSIAVDVDGTLYANGRPNESVIRFLRRKKAEGYSLTLWSMRGEAHARQAAEHFGLAGLFDHVISKPGYIVDDYAWRWTRWTHVIDRNEIHDHAA